LVKSHFKKRRRKVSKKKTRLDCQKQTEEGRGSRDEIEVGNKRREGILTRRGGNCAVRNTQMEWGGVKGSNCTALPSTKDEGEKE